MVGLAVFGLVFVVVEERPLGDARALLEAVVPGRLDEIPGRLDEQVRDRIVAETRGTRSRCWSCLAD
jgi:hypothetical protein